jgi:hypothetical protein
MGFVSKQIAKARLEMGLPSVDEAVIISPDGHDGDLSSEVILLATTASISSIGLSIGLCIRIIDFLSMQNGGYGRFFWIGFYGGLVAALWYAVQRALKRDFAADEGATNHKLVAISRYGYVSALAIFLIGACLPVLYVLGLIILVSLGLGVVGAGLAWSWLVS